MSSSDQKIGFITPFLSSTAYVNYWMQSREMDVLKIHKGKGYKIMQASPSGHSSITAKLDSLGSGWQYQATTYSEGHGLDGAFRPILGKFSIKI